MPPLVQKRGALVAVRPDDGIVLHASTSVEEHLGLPVDDVLGAPLAVALGEEAAGRLLDRIAATTDLEAINPLPVSVPGSSGARFFDAVLHRISAEHGGLVVVELEPSAGEPGAGEPAGTASSTYGVVRTTLGDLARATSLDEMFRVTVRAVHALTGFDRVAVYRLDASGNAEVVADAYQPHIGSAVGVHFPASDLPPAAGRMYRRRGVHYVADLAVPPSEVRSAVLPAAAVPLDLATATLGVPDAHQEEIYRSRGLRSVLSVGLFHGGRLWGLVKCHGYDHPVEVSYDVRAAVELLCATLSALSSAQLGRDRDVESGRQERVLAHLAADSRDESVPLGVAITRSGWTRRLVSADGAIVRAEGRVTTVGTVPEGAAQAALLDWVCDTGDEVFTTDCLRETAPDVAAVVPDVAGVMGIALPEGQVLVWLRNEVQRRVDWGGDPSESRPVRADDPIRTMLRGSDERWREVVDGHSLPWTDDQVESAAALRGHLVEALYLRGRKDVRATEELQRSLLPEALPGVDGWTVEARYDAAGSGLVGGDWYDALHLPSGRLALVVGDVTGHGLQAAATMGQLRTSLRASLVITGSARESVRRLVEVARWTLPGEVATLTVAVLDPATGVVENVVLGHPPLLVVHPDGTPEWAAKADAPPLGITQEVPAARRLVVPPGGALVLYSDGLIERRDETIKAGLARLEESFSGGPSSDIDEVVRHTRDERSADDATLLVVRRD
ncbi:SpoIIE family protein phosphatase [Antribacter gilvus]|uniref:SpoIIE family protein phosphatase n=1 Tax=Antribacter gilvus TaxID=2304675 RepID=UPI000F7A4BEC|nr:SpoIIE family protein phosphatase [Antribacter gilvus]